MWQGVTALEDAGALDDPFGIAAEFTMQLLVSDHQLGHIATCGDHLDARESETLGPLNGGALFAHIRLALATDFSARGQMNRDRGV